MWWAVNCLVVLALQTAAVAQESDTPESVRVEGASRLEATVGMAGVVKQVVLPGTELAVREVNPRTTPVALRIDAVYPHGNSFRYDLTWFGLEPGTHDLCDYVIRKDGTPTDDLPSISVTVHSILPADRLRPNEADSGLMARIGGYRVWVTIAVSAWIVGLFAIIFVGRSKKLSAAQTSLETVPSPLDQIQRLVDRALQSGELNAQDKADLDVRILNFWRERRHLADVPVADALTQLKTDHQAGPLLIGVEQWFYNRHVPDRDEIASLLEPLSQLATSDIKESATTATIDGGVG